MKDDFKERLKEVRKEQGFSQKEVAEMVGVSASCYANYEQGTREPSLSILAKICDALDVSSDYLLGLDDWI